MCMFLGSIELMCTLWAYIYVAFCIYLLSVYIVCVCLHVCISIYIMVNVLCSQSIAICMSMYRMYTCTLCIQSGRII